NSSRSVTVGLTGLRNDVRALVEGSHSPLIIRPPSPFIYYSTLTILSFSFSTCFPPPLFSPNMTTCLLLFQLGAGLLPIVLPLLPILFIHQSNLAPHPYPRTLPLAPPFKGFQEGEIITFCLLGFAVFLTFTVVIYYKCIAPSVEARSRVIFNPKAENRRLSTYGKELFGRFVKKNDY
ncbi:hypothetical protein PFISCL1PPCAC_6385, partial [Pristionchus fissidentatus]